MNVAVSLTLLLERFKMEQFLIDLEKKKPSYKLVVLNKFFQGFFI